MKVYLVVDHDYEGSYYFPPFADRALAEEFAKSRGGGYEIEEYELLTELPKRVTKYYAQKRGDGVQTGSTDWWDYDIAGLPQSELMFWADSEAEAVAGLKKMQSA